MEKAFQSFTFSQNFTHSEALDIILGNQKRNSCHTGHTLRAFSLLIQEESRCRDLLDSMKSRPGQKLGDQVIKLISIPLDQAPSQPAELIKGLWLANLIFP